MLCLMVARTIVIGFTLMNIYPGRFIVVRYEVDCQIRARRVCQPGGRKSRGILVGQPRTGDSTQGTLTASISSVREYGVPLFAPYTRLSTRLTVAWNWGVRSKTDIAPWPHKRFHNSVNHIQASILHCSQGIGFAHVGRKCGMTSPQRCSADYSVRAVGFVVSSSVCDYCGAQATASSCRTASSRPRPM